MKYRSNILVFSFFGLLLWNRKAKITDFDISVVDEDIRWLDISVKESSSFDIDIAFNNFSENLFGFNRAKGTIDYAIEKVSVSTVLEY